MAKIEGTVRYLGIEVDDALWIAEQVDVLERCHGRIPNGSPVGNEDRHLCRRLVERVQHPVFRNALEATKNLKQSQPGDLLVLWTHSHLRKCRL